MGCHDIMIAFAFFITYFLCRMLHRCEGNMLSGDYITGNKTLISATGTFALGFFSPENSSKSYVGIWYHDLGPTKTVVWVANRDSPQDSPGKFTLRDSNLLVLDSTGKIVWSTNITSQHSVNTTVGLLRDDGNLLLLHDEETVWESFNTSSDAALPGKILSVNKKTNKEVVLSSWSNKQDPRPGIFTFGIDPQGFTQFLTWKNSKRYWRSNVYGLSETESTYGVWKNMDNFLLTLNFLGDEHYMKFELISPGHVDKASIFLTSDGQIHLLFWLGNVWASIWSAPSHMCDFYGYCGPSGVCDSMSESSSWQVCKCLPGYKPRNKQEWDKGEWSGGCMVERDLDCNNRDGFLKVKKMKLPDLPIMLGMMNVSTCQSWCLQNCSCSAYGYFDMPNNKVRDDDVEGRDDIITCLNWHGNLLDLVELFSGDEKGRDLYVRIPGSKSGIFNFLCFGYMSPEYGLYGKFSEKSDVFSFGVLLIEIMSGKRNINFHCENLSQILQIWAWNEWKNGKTLEIIDSSIRDTCPVQQAERYIHIGLLCVQEAPIDRPTMSSVIVMLGNKTIPLPSPKEPAFWMNNGNTSLHQSLHSLSYNEMTITWSEVR
ncbi:putative G-type lectin S-receptor-like serine/threonine-protein kinase At1g61610 [Carica papaya]|uniref:putative G-type lectin S-receptor-like serine/threonine-protein kinase At1g61610 n=1 Tax=Carica papaya TaxID=3649 RepID=UPI000B8CA57D|nr:putative G-type lectin S-receptor-like serine/threonine-protein kinase At1g61610 [Carica papaya]